MTDFPPSEATPLEVRFVSATDTPKISSLVWIVVANVRRATDGDAGKRSTTESGGSILSELVPDANRT